MRKVTDNQIGLLRALVREGRWDTTSGWSWGGKLTTLRAMRVLVRRGLASKMDSGEVEGFVPTDAGKKKILETK